MLAWLSANIGTIVVALILMAVVAVVIFVMIRDRKKGVSNCGGNCANCKVGCSHSVNNNTPL